MLIGSTSATAGKRSGWRGSRRAGSPSRSRWSRNLDLNVNRRGVVFVPTVRPDWVDALAARVADASLAVYEALLELEDTA